MFAGPYVYRSTRGTKHFGYRPLDKDETATRPPPSSPGRGLPPNNVRSSQRNVRAEVKGRRQQARSSASATSATVASSSKSNNEDLLIDLSDDTSSTRSARPPSSAKSKPKASSGSASNADVLSLLDGSIDGKYDCLPLPLGEKQTAAAYDPFEVSAELKGFSSRTATPQHSIAAAKIRPPQTGLVSPDFSSSSFDSFSSQGTDDDSPVAKQNVAKSNDPFSRRGMTGSSVDIVRQSGLIDNGTGAVPRGNSLTNLPVYGNLPGFQSQENSMSRSYCPSASADRTDAVFRETENGAMGSKSTRSPNKRQAKQQDAAAADFNANPVSTHQVTSASSLSRDWLENAISKNLSLVKTTANSNRVDADSLTGAASKSTAMAALWDEKNLSKGAAAAALKKSSQSRAAFIDRSDEDAVKSVVAPSFGIGAQTDFKSVPPPIPPRDYSAQREVNYGTGLAPSVYANVGDILRTNGGLLSTVTELGGSATRLTAEVRPFLQQSSDIYQNFEEFSPSLVQPLASPVYANSDGPLGEISNGGSSGAGRRPRAQSSFNAATTGSGIERAPDVAGRSAVDRVHRRVPSASRDECRAALAACNSDIESAARHLKVDQLVRLGVAPRDRCRTLLEACNWNLESAGSVLLHELSTGSSV